MGLFDKWGKDNAAVQPRSADDQAVERYRYMLRTAPPESIEQAHAEAFAQLTPEQRRIALQKMVESAPASERSALEQGGTNPQALARIATRAEIRQPGAMERMFGPSGGVGPGGLFASTLLGSIAGTVLGSAIAHQFFAHEGFHADTLADASEPRSDPGFTEVDHDTDDSSVFDDGDFDDGTFEV